MAVTFEFKDGKLWQVTTNADGSFERTDITFKALRKLWKALIAKGIITQAEIDGQTSE